jgi:hypothetical protein
VAPRVVPVRVVRASVVIRRSYDGAPAQRWVHLELRWWQPTWLKLKAPRALLEKERHMELIVISAVFVSLVAGGVALASLLLMSALRSDQRYLEEVEHQLSVG